MKERGSRLRGLRITVDGITWILIGVIASVTVLCAAGLVFEAVVALKG